MTTRWARFTRGWIAAAVSVFVALCSHALAGGDVPGPAGVALCLAFAGMASIALAGKSLSLPRLAISVVFSQFIFHGLFSMLGAPATTTATTPRSMGDMMSAAPVHLEPLADTGMAMPAWMWLAHAVAVVVTIAALRYGERAFWALLELAKPWLLRVLFLPTAPAAGFKANPPFTSTWVPTSLADILSSLRYRGPPALTAQ